MIIIILYYLVTNMIRLKSLIENECFYERIFLVLH